MTAESNQYVPAPRDLQRDLPLTSASEVVLLAAEWLRVGSVDHAAAVCEAWEGAPDPAVTLCLAAAEFGRGRRDRAVALVEGVLAAAPEHASALFYRAQMAQQCGDAPLALALVRRVVERFPDYPGAASTLATWCMPGPSYRDVLQRAHDLLRPEHYLEIGVETGATLALAHGARRAVGVDPDRTALRRELVPKNARVFHETSDDFFAQHSRRELFGERGVHFSFIDGMHWFEYALRDFIHAEAWSEPNGVIAIHDCLPVFSRAASRERRSKFWLGDVWKLVACLYEYRPDLRVTVIATAPSGLCFVRGLDPASKRLAESTSEILERYLELPYPAAGGAPPPAFRVLPSTAQSLREALS